MKLSEFVKQLNDINYDYFHSHRVDGGIPEELNISVLSQVDGKLIEPKLGLDAINGVIIFYEQ